MTITRTGTWPVFKYTFRDKGDFAVIMMDDDAGDIFINSGDQVAFKHWWGRSGRGTNKLREFLVKAGFGYFQDKFSYGLSRWSIELAVENLKKELIEHFGPQTEWSYDVSELFEELESNNYSSDLFYMKLYDCSEIMDKLDGSDLPSGEMYGNGHVTHFLKEKWPHFVEFWKKELEDEKMLETAVP